MRVLLRARNSLRSFRCRARKPGPCRARARHFAFSETGQAGHTLGVCCFAPKIRCAHFGAPLANPAPSVPLKNTNSNANNWRICVFFASLQWPRNPACGPRAGLALGWPRHAPAGAERQTRWRFPCARETVRMTFARSGALRLPENGILKRVRPPARLRESISVRQTFRSGTCGKFPYGNLSDGTL